MNGLRRNGAEAPDDAGIRTSPLVAIVILNWNGKAFLQQFLPFVLASTYANKRIIVADNASKDGSVQFLRDNFPTVEIIVHGANHGFARGYNLALATIAADYYVLLNSDVEVTPGWIEPVMNLMEQDRAIGACQPKILSFHKRGQFEYAGACGGWLDSLGYPFARGRVFDRLEDDHGQYDDAAPCFWASGAALFVRAACYHEAGGLDEYFFAHQEEIDLCWRLQLAGYTVFVQPGSVVYHVGGGTLAAGNNQKTFLNFRNNLVMLVKHLPAGRAFGTIMPRMLLDAVAAWRELLRGNGAFFVAVAKAHIQFTKWLFYKRPKQAGRVKELRALPGWYSGSVVWQHFIKRKQLFSQIVKDK